MQQLTMLGKELRTIRKAANESLAQTAKALGIDRSHLNKIELGAYKPSLQLLNDILAHFSVEGIKANQLRDLLTRGPVEHVVVGGSEERNTAMAQETPVQQQPVGQVSLDPSKNPVVYTDSTFVSSTDYGLVLDVAQTVGGNPQQNFVVARIGMSFDHDKKLIEVMNDHLQKHER
jgi:transcriptional regulator with XRE-family HTH domain